MDFKVGEHRSVDVKEFRSQVKPPRLIWMLRLMRRWVPPASRQERMYRWLVYSIRRMSNRLKQAWPGYAEKRYERWQAENEPDANTTTKRVQDLNSLYDAPRLSIILYPSLGDLSTIQTSVLSIQSQTYHRWELCILLRETDEAAVKQEGGTRPPEDERICLKRFDPTAEPFPDLLSEIKGDYVILIPQGDMLAPHALWEIASVLSQKPNVDMLYTDQDRFDAAKERRVQPWFKPDWSPELLLSINYLTPLIVRKRILIEFLAKDWRLEEDASLWNLAFHCVEKARDVLHIPKVLYHTNSLRSQRRSAEMKSASVVASHLARIGISDVDVRRQSTGSLQVLWPTGRSLVSIIIPTKDQPQMLRRCLDGILHRTVYPHVQIVLVDNGSKNSDTLKYYRDLSTDKRVRFVPYDESFNYSVANNIGARHAEGEHLLFLNDDVEIIEQNWLVDMVRWSERNEIGAVGAKLLFSDGTIQHAGIVVGLGGHAGHVFRGAREGETGPFGSVEWYRNYLAVTGACMMVPRSVFQEVGGFNEEYQLAFGDVDLCLRIVERGYRVLYTPFARLLHHESVSRGRYIPTHDLVKGFIDLEPLLLEGDPYYNPNLSCRDSISRLKVKPEDRTRALEKILARRLSVEG